MYNELGNFICTLLQNAYLYVFVIYILTTISVILRFSLRIVDLVPEEDANRKFIFITVVAIVIQKCREELMR